MTKPSRRLISRAEIRDRIPYSDVHIWRLEREGLFPHRVQVGPHRVAWYADEIDAWCAGLTRTGAHQPPGSKKARAKRSSEATQKPLTTAQIVEELSYLAEIITEVEHDPKTLAALEAAIERLWRGS